MKKTLWAICFIASAAATLNAQEIFDAIRGGNLTKVKELVEKNGELLNARNTNQSTPLHVAVDVSTMEIVKYLIEKGADVNAINRSQQTPIFYAKGGEITGLLIDQGANINQTNINRFSVLMYVETLEAAKILVEKGADINFETRKNGLTALHVSLANRRREKADYLLEKGAKIKDPASSWGVTELKLALQAGSIKYLNKYLELGYSIKIEDDGVANLIHYAAEANSVEIINKLIDLGVPVNARNLFGWSPLHIAAYKNNGAVFKFLLEKGFDKNSRTTNGKSPYNLAEEANSREIMELLILMQADTSGTKFPELAGEYMGQKRPGNKPEPFAPGIVGAQYNFHSSIVFSPDGNEAYWSGANQIACMKNINGKWTEPAIFSEGDSPFISPDGNKFYFVKYKQTDKGNREIIYVRDKTATGWSEPQELSETVNSKEGIHWQVSVDNNRNIYFTSNNYPAGKSNIYYSENKEGKYQEPKLFEGLRDINADLPFIAPDGSYLIAQARDSRGGLMILFKKKDGSWTERINLSNHFQGINLGECSYVTHDGKYLFLIRSGGSIGKGIPYWVDASFIEDLRKEALKNDK